MKALKKERIRLTGQIFRNSQYLRNYQNQLALIYSTTPETITDPKLGLTVDEVNTAMAGMIEQAIFAPDGQLLTAKVKAELVITDKSPFSMS
ncbi:MAG: hypothetical protein CVU99_06850 [Firmicutes bacterium HGW-Firmicutes-4]|jgi:hypothetical protein|nr:MAG: hypothetical protein CVU99_06850 [Firmicutes bacterium HGW-Firmicutes-4]